jgi:hypothetical protein
VHILFSTFLKKVTEFYFLTCLSKDRSYKLAYSAIFPIYCTDKRHAIYNRNGIIVDSSAHYDRILCRIHYEKLFGYTEDFDLLIIMTC